MPFGDRTGYCAGFSGPGYMNPVAGRGLSGFGLSFGRGRGWFGRGRRWRNCFWARGLPGGAGYGYPPYEAGITAKDEMDMLRDQSEFLKQ